MCAKRNKTELIINRKKRRKMRKKRSKRKERRGNGEIHNGRPWFFFTSHLLLYVSTCTLLARFYTTTGYSYTSLIAAFATTFPRKSAHGKNEAEKCLVFFSVSNVFNDFICRWRGCTYTRASTLISPPEQQRNSFIVTRSISGWKYIRPTRTYECTHYIYVRVCVCMCARTRIVLSDAMYARSSYGE